MRMKEKAHQLKRTVNFHTWQTEEMAITFGDSGLQT